MDFKKIAGVAALALFIGTVFALSIMDSSQEPLGQAVPCRADTAKAVHERISDCPIPANERASFKGQEIAKQVQSVPRTKREGYDIEIVEVKAIEGGVEVFARAWKDGEQIGFGKDGSVGIERFVIVNPPILVPDPAGNIIREWTDEDTGELRQRKLREDPQEALLQVLEHTIKVKEQKFGSENIVKGKVGNTTLTAFPVAGTGTAPMDAWFRRTGVDETYSTIRDSAGNSLLETNAAFQVGPLASATTDQFQRMNRFGAGFDTSSIGTDDVDSAIISFHQGGADLIELDDVDVNITSFSPGDGSAMAATDYNIANHGSTKLSDTGVSVSAFGASDAYSDWTLNASGEAHINKSGNTYFSVRTDWDIDDNFTGTWSSGGFTRIQGHQADETGTSADPKLVVEHSAAAAPAAAPAGRPVIFE